MDPEEITVEQVQELQNKLAELETFKTDSAAKLAEYDQAKTELEQLKKDKADLEGQANPNWKEAREKMGRLESLLKGKGIEVDELGNPKGSQVSLADVERKTAEVVTQKLLNARLEEILDDYDPASKEVIRHYYNKLSAGEEITLQNIRKFVNEAERAAGSDNQVKKIQLSGGLGPRMGDESKLGEQEAKDLGAKMGLPFATATDKK